MENERKRVLTMVENGTITVEEALTLLEAMEKGTASGQAAEPSEGSFTNQSGNDNRGTSFGQERKRSKEESAEEFIENLRNDMGHVGERFMQFMQTAVERVKSFDFETPFSGGVSFTHSSTKTAEGIEEIIVDISNGSFTIIPTEEQEVKAEFAVKSFNNKTEDEAKDEFLKKMIFVKDDDKLRFVSDMKLIQVNVTVHVPEKDYEKLSVRLLNGTLQTSGLHAANLYAKTGNGKIDISGSNFKEAELETGNGAIQAKNITGETLSAEAMNGRVYISGDIKNAEGKSLNGHVVITTTNRNARLLDAKTVSGSVEIYVPSDIPLAGEITTNMGRLDLQLQDVHRSTTNEQFMYRSIGFQKGTDEERAPLRIAGETKTGSVIVCYNVN